MSQFQRLDETTLHGVCNSFGDFAVSDVTLQKMSGEIAYRAHRVHRQ